MNKLRDLAAESVKARYRSVRGWLLSQSLRARGPFFLLPEESQATKAISVIVAVHDAPQVTTRCLSSLERFSGDGEVVIVDDASQLEAVQKMLDDACARNGWKLIRHGKAMGHSRASEAGVSVSTRPYICLLNSDTVITPHSWAAVLRAFEVSPQIAVAGPSTSYTSGPQQVRRACHCRHYWTDEQIWCFAQKYVARHREEPLADLLGAGGFAFFIRRSAWDELDGFDRNLPDYGNESELCQRVLQRGWRIVWTKAAYIHHFGSASYGRSLGLDSVRERRLQATSYIQAKHGGNRSHLR